MSQSTNPFEYKTRRGKKLYWITARIFDPDGKYIETIKSANAKARVAKIMGMTTDELGGRYLHKLKQIGYTVKYYDKYNNEVRQEDLPG